jgi:hypothetical protein
MFYWTDKMRKILLENSSNDKEKVCQEMITFGVSHFNEKIKLQQPNQWAVASFYQTEVEEAIMHNAIPGSYTSKMVSVSADHACFIADYGWKNYEKSMLKPLEITNTSEFFYNDSFNDYDEKKIEYVKKLDETPRHDGNLTNW